MVVPSVVGFSFFISSLYFITPKWLPLVSLSPGGVSFASCLSGRLSKIKWV